MPNADDVRPHRWTQTRVLFDNGYYSAVWGTFEGVDEPARVGCLGVRWNGSGNRPGYPSQGAYPVWYREPDFMASAVLHALRKELLQGPKTNQQSEYLRNVDAVLAEIQNGLTKE